ncbi:carbohydrate ABC transporter permease [Mahella australiensis]|uniref:Carbohydrate ABC transporter membrane protein 2, CUT1 family n=1 Tax=Mahella australiensis (strain DSM 15567 / CIP 107919 / 50-1 BON) TaxID=697281 RepID=F4A167_MAHA5|nr:carbohydrate ABC transporter permease [Mahella australiensis]AEE95970.1 carbohydrate ABC transporter membrane protein 2, CUT1 family [Mahella australiensis 50-1 BON]
MSNYGEVNAAKGISSVIKSKQNKQFKLLIKDLLIYLLLIIGSVLFITPFLWMLSTSLKGEAGLFDIPPQWIPNPIKWGNYPEALQSIPFLKYTMNTVFITVVAMAGAIVSSSLVAYSFARLKWPGRDIWFIILLATMMLPGQVTMIPVFVMYKNLGWINTYAPLTVPYFFGSAFYIFLLRQFFRTIPMELSDSAKIDGCSEFRIYWKIILPLSKPALATVAIFTFMGVWNDFVGPLIYLNDTDKFTLALGLRSFQMQYGTRWNLMMAAAIVAALPTLIIFFLCQKYFIEGITLTGIKA